MTRYLPRYLPSFLSGGREGEDSQAKAVAKLPTEAEYQAGLADLRELIEMIRQTGAKVVLVQHLEREELGGAEKEGYTRIRAVAEAMSVPAVSTGPALSTELKAGRNPYRDHIHLSAAGQAVLAEVLTEVVSPES